MLEWTLTHPWFTFWIILAIICCVSGLATNICKLINNRMVLEEIRIKAETGWNGDSTISPREIGSSTSEESEPDESAEEWDA